MSSLVFLVPLGLLLGGTALAAFLWSLKSGQYDDLDGAAERILLDDDDERDLKAAQTTLPVPTSPQNNRDK
ncbi:cbb3-type cytochrome oxidase assembly protein CcoS [Bosea sp. NBC_00550]|uniref:cbb3-type cytochrome oxidase assembly protein CcoS n=1 Tax=Bosea sp. NBC_00550 TaxID=2969621 RepID=UPI00223000C2|nr:cbb3-type cytochrome oxidase assembly protein CcoS [Bosea sp. NBC_00550]UZF95433.1 cbb3-type cytochrome oxidase assembly protein CcoS [Bosea sp. NBC_00550]